MAQLSDDCFAFGGALLPIEAARSLIFERVGIVAGVETIGLAQGDGRTLAEPVTAPSNVPGFTNSAVDGYAVRFDDLAVDADYQLDRFDKHIAGDRVLIASIAHAEDTLVGAANGDAESPATKAAAALTAMIAGLGHQRPEEP